MALWGEIKVNQRVIGSWSAVRIDGGIEPDDLNLYQCDVEMGLRKIWRGEIEHRYGDGALVLASKVLGASLEYG